MEEKKILEMIEAGKITAAEGLELLSAIKETEEETEEEKDVALQPKSSIKPKKNYKFLRVQIDVKEEDIKVNVNIPLKLLKVIGDFMPQLNGMIPEDAKLKMQEKGIDLSTIDIEAILEAIELGDLEDNVLLDITSNDKEDGPVHVKVYVD